MLLIAAVLIGFGLWHKRSRPTIDPNALAQRGVLTGWNVILISIDTCRADHIACYGHRSVRTPTIDRLAAEGVRFARAVAPTPLTLPSHTTLLTGLNPPRHGVRNNGTFKLDESVTTLAECLKAKGYRTGAVISAFVLDRRFGLAQGFETYDDDLAVGDRPSVGSFRERRAEQTNVAAKRWLGEHGKERFFLFIHYYDPHWPYTAPSPFGEQYADTPYDGEIAYVDEQIGRLMSALDATGARDRTVVIVTGDHGESLGEHNEMSHGIFIYDATQLVPLVIGGSPRLPAGKVIKPQVGLVDIAPTILDVLGIDRPPGLEGRNLFGPPADPRWVYIESLGAELMHGCAPLFGVRGEDTKFIRAPKPELYDLQTDPCEINNLVADRGELARRMNEVLGTFMSDRSNLARRDLPLSEEEAERLRGLGYVAAAGRASATTTKATTSAPTDPKDLIVHLRRSQLAQEHIARGDFEKGLPLLEEYVRACPQDVMSLYRLAEAYRTVGRLDDSLSIYRRILERLPDDTEARAGAGSVLLRQGKIDEAESEFRRILKADPNSPGGLLGMGGVQAVRGDVDRAIETLKEVVKRSQGQPAVNAYTNLGALYERQGKIEEARRAYGEALRLDPGQLRAAQALAQSDLSGQTSPQAIERLRESIRRNPTPDGYLTLGQVLRRTGQLVEAEEALQQAMKQRPKHAGTCFELGAVRSQQGQAPEAEALLRQCIALDPNHAEAHSELGMLEARRGNLEPAAQWLSQAVRLAPAQANHHYNLGIVFEQLGPADKAVASLRRATELDPRHAQAHFHLGQVLTAQGQKAEAIVHLRKALEIRANYPEAKALLDRLQTAQP